MQVPRLLFAPFRPAARWAYAAGVAGMVLLIAASALTVPRCYALPKQDYTGAQEYVERHRREGSPVVVVGTAGQVYEKYFAPQWSFPRTARELAQLHGDHPDLTLVYSLPIELKAFQPEIWRIVERDFETVRVFPGTLGGGEVYVSQSRVRRATN